MKSPLNGLTSFSGLRILESDHMVDQVEDWSQVRSPARAERRRRRGFPQRIRIVEKPKQEVLRIGDTLVMHPAIARELRAAIDAQAAHAAVVAPPAAAPAHSYKPFADFSPFKGPMFIDGYGSILKTGSVT